MYDSRQNPKAPTAAPTPDFLRHAWLGIDVLVWVVALAGATMLRDMYVLEPRYLRGLAVVAVVAALLQVAVGTAAGVYRRSPIRGSYDEVLGLGQTAMIVTGTLLLASLVRVGGQRLVPGSVAVVAGLSALVAMLASRLVIRSFRARRGGSELTPIIVMGAGSAGRLLVHNLLHDGDSPYRPVALLDDDPRKRSLRIEGVKVAGGLRDLATVAKRRGAEALVIAMPSAEPSLMRELHQLAESAGLRVMVLPRLTSMLHGQVRGSDIRDIKVEDLLGRPPVKLDESAIAREVIGKSVLVTGASGSIGSELCRQIARYGPHRLVLLDRDESALHALELSLYGHGLLESDSTVLADIRDREQLRKVFEETRPEVVFHAAALKHLPLLERHPAEAWKSNVIGTLNVLEAAAGVGVKTFVNISTDKAADPSSVLGYTKRVAERLTAYYANRCSGRFISVRFGNVLGSRGSVIHAFTDQIRRGHPLTVTHPDVERYFMLIPEACQLVLQAAALGHHDGEVLVLDMGTPVRIADVARTLIELSGRNDIEIEYCGLRPGEKLSEDLFAGGEERRPTEHPSVTHVEVSPLSPAAWNGLDPECDDDCVNKMRKLAFSDAYLVVNEQGVAARQVADTLRRSGDHVIARAQ